MDLVRLVECKLAVVHICMGKDYCVVVVLFCLDSEGDVVGKLLFWIRWERVGE